MDLQDVYNFSNLQISNFLINFNFSFFETQTLYFSIIFLLIALLTNNTIYVQKFL